MLRRLSFEVVVVVVVVAVVMGGEWQRGEGAWRPYGDI